MRCLFISSRFLSHQTFPSRGDSPDGFVTLAYLHEKQCSFFIFNPAKHGICLLIPICIPRLPHHTVPDTGFNPSGFVSLPYLQSLHTELIFIFTKHSMLYKIRSQFQPSCHNQEFQACQLPYGNWDFCKTKCR